VTRGSLQRRLSMTLAFVIVVGGIVAAVASFGFSYLEARELQDDALRKGVTSGIGPRARFQRPTSPATTLMEKPRIATLNAKLSTDWAVTTLRMLRVMTRTSEVCTATAMVNAK
jgi:hypothetical protein